MPPIATTIERMPLGIHGRGHIHTATENFRHLFHAPRADRPVSELVPIVSTATTEMNLTGGAGASRQISARLRNLRCYFTRHNRGKNRDRESRIFLKISFLKYLS